MNKVTYPKYIIIEAYALAYSNAQHLCKEEFLLPRLLTSIATIKGSMYVIYF